MLFRSLTAFSVTIWLLFEALNLYLLNWRYVGLEPRLWLRWPGYVLAFATVLPGIFLTAELLAALGVGQRLKAKARPLGLPAWQPLWLLLGAACLALPFAAPTWAFPLIWLAFFFLGDACLDLLSGDSLTRQFLAGERQRPLCLMLAGLLCGLWWELWNYPSPARWIYTLPLLNFGKIFEMPVLGYLGFMPFALEAAVLYRLMVWLDDRLAASPRRPWFYLAQGGFWLVLFWALDVRTVLTFRIPGP